MKYPPRFASRQRPPRETPAPPRRLIASAIFVGGFLIAVLGAFHDVHSTGKEPTTHLPPHSPLPTAGGFQVLGNPAPSLTPERSPSPTAALRLHRDAPSPSPALTVAPAAPGLSPVQDWSSAAVLTPEAPAAAVATTDVGASTPSYNPGPVNLQVAPTPTSSPTPRPISTPTPTPQPSASPTPTPKPSPTPTPQPSTTLTPQPLPSGSPSCVPTKHHPCQPRGDK